jgi:hypothetical protein
MVIGEDISVLADDHAGTKAAFNTAARSGDVAVAEKELEERVVVEGGVLPADNLQRRDIRDRRDGAFGHAGEVGRGRCNSGRTGGRRRRCRRGALGAGVVGGFVHPPGDHQPGGKAARQQYKRKDQPARIHDYET